ncbi:MAG: nucleotide disphospho-sugar-binding domain-containing protein [Gammaproteobacteria bacterium]
MNNGRTIAFFPEAAFGPALNSVGIAQACRELGHRAVFMRDVGFRGVFAKYGFEEFEVPMSAPMAPEDSAKYWSDFITRHIANFRKSPFDQLDNYVKECWEAIIDTARWAQKGLPAALEAIRPDLVCVDNVILFPAIKQYGVPWVRIVSCSENEVEDPAIAPYLSGCTEGDVDGFRRFRARYLEVIAPLHAQFNAFLVDCGEPPYPEGCFFEESPYMNLLLYPAPTRFPRSRPLDPARFQYLDGCVREDEDYTVPDFGSRNDQPLIYVSFGTLGASDTELMARIIRVMGTLPYCALVNVGDYRDSYADVPDNVHLAPWFPQPSVIPQVDAVIHHGGNNTFTECLYFGKPALIMPYVWDGHDNATRIQETGHGLKLPRYDWSDADLGAALHTLLNDAPMRRKLADTRAFMQSGHGPQKAARVLDALLRQR